MARIRHHIFFNVLLIILFISSCNKKVTAPVDTTTPENFTQLFEDYWNLMNTNYAFWDIDTTNWDMVHNTYQPLFAQLNMQDDSDKVKSVQYFKQITSGMIDSHYTMSFTMPGISGSLIFPAESRKRTQPDYHDPYSYLLVDSSYFDKGYVSGSYLSSDYFQMRTDFARIDTNILYFHCDHFALYEAYHSSSGYNIKLVLDSFFNALSYNTLNTKGIIIDVRNNDGGNIEDLNFLIGHLTNQTLKFGYTRYKSGNGRLDYTPWIDAKVIPFASTKTLSIPIIVLADNYSISLAEIATIAIHTLPTGKFIGETTWGATGGITNNIIYNDGQFAIPDILSVYTASSEFKYINDINYEGKGFSPDILVPFNLSTLKNRVDPSLQKALNYINNNNF